MANCPKCGRWDGRAHRCPTRKPPTAAEDRRGLISVLGALVGRRSAPTVPVAQSDVPVPSSIHSDLHAAFRSSTSAFDPRFRFGPDNVEHAKVSDLRLQVLDALDKPESFVWQENGQSQTVQFTRFNPTHARPLVRELAAAVLEADRPANGRVPFTPRVYSTATLAAARRIVEAPNDMSFSSPKYPGEGTEWFPFTTRKTAALVVYDHTVHEDIRALLSGVNKDQQNSAKLQADIAAYQAESTARAASRFDDPFAGI